MDDLIAEFLTETNESLEELDADLVTLEQNPNDTDLLSRIFRVMHTIKGTCGFLGLPRLESVAHKAEDVLGLFRDGTLEVTPDYVTLIFDALDRIKYIVGELEANGAEPDGDDDELKARLQTVYEKAGKEEVSEEELEAAFAAADTGSDSQEEESADGETDQDEGDAPEEIVMAVPEEASPPAEKEEEVAVKAPAQSSVANQTLRVNVETLENLMTTVSELVLTRNQLLQILRTQQESEFSAPLQRLNHVVSDLQEGVMQTRMQPVGNAWAKLPRIVRDISVELGKKIDLQMKGKETELDRQVLELIKDPLTHMVRNSADHGIETPEERVAAGKPEMGTIELNSFHEGGHIIIEISDDGKGLPVDKIRQKVLDNGLATEEELESMTPQQIQMFIFKAGFSTAEQVTSVSGRGVGMDVVRTNIEKIGGSIDLRSEEGKGSVFTIKIPLTLAIVSALIVAACGERFAIPQLAVRELVMTSVDGDNRIETIKGSPVFRLRDQLLALVSLEDILKLSGAPVTEETGAPDQEFVEEDNVIVLETAAETPQEENYHNKYIVVTQVGSYSFGLIVDKVYDTEEIVIKPVANILKDIEMFSGNTILGDGTVIMILDPAGIAKCSGEMETQDAQDQDAEEAIAGFGQEKTSLLLFSAGSDAPKAVPLELVARLEEIEADDVEMANDRPVIQYRGQLMPLVSFDDNALAVKEREGRIPVLVFSGEEGTMGMIVDKIIDITEEHVDVQMAGHDGLLGSAIIDEKATDVVDVGAFLQSINQEWLGTDQDVPFNAAAAGCRVLLVEDSPFFRNMLTPFLSVAGYEVMATDGAENALNLCESGEKFDLIISDIEMPGMNGFELAQTIKTETSWRDTPLVALSSHATPQDRDRGKAAGFSAYVAKFDRDNLLGTLSRVLSDVSNPPEEDVSQSKSMLGGGA